MSEELGVILVALFGGGGIITLLFNRWWKQQDDAQKAYREGIVEGAHGCQEQLDEVRATAKADRERCDAELKKLRDALVVIVQDPDTKQTVRLEVLRTIWGGHPTVPS